MSQTITGKVAAFAGGIVTVTESAARAAIDEQGNFSVPVNSNPSIQNVRLFPPAGSPYSPLSLSVTIGAGATNITQRINDILSIVGTFIGLILAASIGTDEAGYAIPGSAPGGSPGAPNKSIQSNQSGVFTGDALLTWDSARKILALGGTPQVPLDGYSIAGPLNIGPQERTLSQTMQDLISVNDGSVIVHASTGDVAGNTAFSVYAEYLDTNTIQRSEGLSGTSFTTGAGTGTTSASSVGTVGIGVSTPGVGNTTSEFVVGLLGSAQIGTFETSGADAGTVPRLASVYAANNTNWGLVANATVNAGFYSEQQNGIGTLNAAFYSKDQGTAAGDWAFYVVGGNNQLGPNNTIVGFLLPHTIFSAAGTPLPAASLDLKGARAVVSDATLPTFLGAYVSGGAVTSPVFCDGSAWVTA